MRCSKFRPIQPFPSQTLSLQEGRNNHTEDLLLDDRSIIQTSMWYISLLELREQSMHSSQVEGKRRSRLVPRFQQAPKAGSVGHKSRMLQTKNGKKTGLHQLRELSSSCFVFPTTAPAHHPTVVASPEGQVTAHTRGQKGQGN